MAYVQVGLAILIGLYFWNLLRNQQTSKVGVAKESRKETENLRRLREISLSEPLSERTRPTCFQEIVGQEEGLKGLRAALCGPNPQHVIVYGPPGVGKTAAARLVLEEAKSKGIGPFKHSAKFVEIDATTARFDERGIADPLIGSVHDPIYQGAGPLGMAGVPQPKPGAVTKAHGGVLFIDEIGELHPIQMNKLLKVLEDRKVFLESAYFNPDDSNVPSHIKDIFENGLPADFRLIGATTRMPEDIPAAIRSRCLEVFFKPLRPAEVGAIARNAASKMGMEMGSGCLSVIERFASNGREAVNIVQVAAGIATGEGRATVRQEDVEWVVSSGQYCPRPERRIPAHPQVGCANGLAVMGPNTGIMLEVEVATYPAEGEGRIIVTGIIEEEELGHYGHRMRRKSLVKGSVENVLTVLRRYIDVDPKSYDIHINFPGGVPIDGPSAGVTVATAIYSSITETPISNTVAMTGEVSIRGLVRPVGGVVSKVEAAREAGVTKVIIPRDNWQEIFKEASVEVVPVDTMDEVLQHALLSPTLSVTAS
jgi:Lon-like ATP-dependent protease